MSGARHGSGVFVTWQRHQRTLQIGVRMGIPVVVLQTSRTGVARYASLLRQTFVLLRDRRPTWLIVQSPSYVLAAFAVTIGRLFARAVFVDAHNEAVQPFINNRWYVKHLAQSIMRLATGVIVTNDELAGFVRRCGGKPIVLPDPFPSVPAVGRDDLGPGRHVAVICTYALDEPIAEVIEAARSAPADLRLYLTGAPTNLAASLRVSAPPGIRFTGFLSEQNYWRLLQSVDAIMDLTKMPDCLVCGAYEALAAGVPSILSDNPAGRRLFEGAAVFISPTTVEIGRVLSNLDEAVIGHREQVVDVGRRYAKTWNDLAANFTRELRSRETAS
jgi:glycosyltransferase involved in cell wall biosynthesis